jgi:hypothetical protein
MLNKIIIAIGSAMTIALISWGIYLARELVALEPTCYWHLEEGFNSFNYAHTYLILLIGVGIGVAVITTINELIKSALLENYNSLVEEHDKLTLERDDLRLDAVTQYGEVSHENNELKKELKRLKNEKG